MKQVGNATRRDDTITWQVAAQNGKGAGIQHVRLVWLSGDCGHALPPPLSTPLGSRKGVRQQIAYTGSLESDMGHSAAVPFHIVIIAAEHVVIHYAMAWHITSWTR